MEINKDIKKRNKFIVERNNHCKVLLGEYKNAKNIPQFKDSKVSDLHAAVRRIYDTINAIKKDNPPETWKDFGLDKETLDKIPDADEFEKRLNRLPLV